MIGPEYIEEEHCSFCCERTVKAAHEAVSNSILLGKKTERKIFTKGICLNNTSGISETEHVDDLLLTAQSLQNCIQIAEENPESPVTAIAEAAWNNDERILAGNSVAAFTPHVMERYGPVISILTFANCNAVETEEGLVMIDCGTKFAAPRIYDTIREVTEAPIHTAIYTHGHVDHIMLNHTGFEEEAIKRGDTRTRVIAHENVRARFDRYIMTRGYNTVINQRQFQLPSSFQWEKDYRYPDEVYSSYRRLEIGTKIFELHHCKGETDDATIVWMPEESYVFTGDFFIWNTPNCGNPQKVQRYPLEWIQALKKVAEWRPKILFPGHGPPIIGEDRIQEALKDTVNLLEQFDKLLIEKPYLLPKYDDPRFISATLWRRYAGWYTFEVTRLLTVEKKFVGAELANLVGSPLVLSRRALELCESKEPSSYSIALELAEYSMAAIDQCQLTIAEKNEIHRIRAVVLRKKQISETCLMARSIYKASAIDSEKAIEKPQENSKI